MRKNIFIIAVCFSAVIAVVAVVEVTLIHNITDTTTRTTLAVTAINSVLTAGLICVTAMYVYSTQKIAESTKAQADASMKMAKEMEKQRCDAVLPVLDINISTKYPIGEGLIAELGHLSYRLSGVLRNIGVGPAIDVISFVVIKRESIGSELQWKNFGMIPVTGHSSIEDFALEKRDSQNIMLARYKDSYGRFFESHRIVSRDDNRNDLDIGTLDFHEITKEKYEECKPQ